MAVQTRAIFNALLRLLPGEAGSDGREREHDPGELFAEFLPDPGHFGGHELEGLITYSDRYTLTLCASGRVYGIHLRAATTLEPCGARVEGGAFVRVHGSWRSDGFHASHITLLP